jgi:DNA polymerase
MIIGEAPGEQEAKLGIPFVGAAGNLLNQLLREAGLETGGVYKTNVFHTRPLRNRLESIFLPQSEWKEKFGASNVSPGAPYRIENKIHLLPPPFLPELERLQQEIDKCQPNVILALGNTALWSLTGRQNISSLRGTVLLSTTLSTPRKLLPTFHPAAVLRQWDLRSIVVADLIKAKRQAEFPELRRPSRLVTLSPSLVDLEIFLRETLPTAEALATDVETRNGQITEIGFAPSPNQALVVPFIKGYSSHYWETAATEATALAYVKAILQSPVPKIFQNGLYDIQYIWRNWGFAPRACEHDTMLKHHSLFPEVQKGLGFLGSLYTDEPAWKFMRARKETEGKRDDE